MGQFNTNNLVASDRQAESAFILMGCIILAFFVIVLSQIVKV